MNWWGGGTYGPRLLADMTPLLALLLVPLVDVLTRERVFAGVFLICAVWSIGAHVIGAFWDDRQWNASPLIDLFPRRLWSWRDNQLVNPPLAVFTRAVIALRGLPTSQTAPEHLSAAYRVTLHPALTVGASLHLLQVSLEASNTDEAVWLSSAKGDKGVVQLGWRWRTEGHFLLERPEWVPFGYQPLRYDVLPQQSHDFLVLTFPPSEPGTYLLEISLVSEHVACFSDLGSPPIRLVVKVNAGVPPGLVLSP